jgi:hypothetical protein
MSRIFLWTEADISGLRKTWGIERLLTEVAEEGRVIREIGFDAEGNVVHRYPGVPTKAEYRVLDLTKIAPLDGADMDAEEFERLWSA